MLSNGVETNRTSDPFVIGCIDEVDDARETENLTMIELGRRQAPSSGC
jgi:hypothetical protein